MTTVQLLTQTLSPQGTRTGLTLTPVLIQQLAVSVDAGLLGIRSGLHVFLGYAYLAKPHFAKSETAIQESAKLYFDKPGNC